MNSDVKQRAEALKPCPFCGGEATAEKDFSELPDDAEDYVFCANRECQIFSNGMSRRQWQTRHEAEQTGDARERFEKYIADQRIGLGSLKELLWEIWKVAFQAGRNSKRDDVLEEAAKVCDEWAERNNQRHKTYMQNESTYSAAGIALKISDEISFVAKAILAMKGKG